MENWQLTNIGKNPIKTTCKYFNYFIWHQHQFRNWFRVINLEIKFKAQIKMVYKKDAILFMSLLLSFE